MISGAIRSHAASLTAIQPCDDAGRLFVLDVVNLWWDIRRARKLKEQIIQLAKLKWICKLLSPARPAFLEPPHLPVKTDKLAELWSADAETMQSINEQLEKKGFKLSFVMTQALMQVAPQTEAIDRQIEGYESRRAGIFKSLDQYSQSAARRLAATTEVLEGGYTEAAE
jgi:hypothetical protein